MEVVSTCCVVIFPFECLAAGCVYVFDGRRGRGWIGSNIFVLWEGKDKLLMMAMNAPMFDGSCKNCAKWDVGTHAHLWSSILPLRLSFKIWSTYTKFDQEAVVLPFLFFYQFAALKCSCLQMTTTDRNRRSPQSRCQSQAT